LLQYDISWLVPHQANTIESIDATAKQNGVKVIKKVMLKHTANMENTTPMYYSLCLVGWENQLKKRAIDPNLSALVVGFTWGSIIIKWAYNTRKYKLYRFIYILILQQKATNMKYHRNFKSYSKFLLLNQELS